MDVSYGEEFDEAFLLELDAVEAAAVQRSRAQPDIDASSINGTSEQHGQQRVAAPTTPSDSVMLAHNRSTGTSSNPTACHHGTSNAVGLYRWTVENISVRDDASTEGSAEGRIGQVRTVDAHFGCGAMRQSPGVLYKMPKLPRLWLVDSRLGSMKTRRAELIYIRSIMMRSVVPAEVNG